MVVIGWVQIRLMRRVNNPRDAIRILELNATTEVSNIQSTGGVPTLEQLTQDIEIAPEYRWMLHDLYEIGLTQFNHEINNRDGILAESRKAMDELKVQLCSSEIERAEKVGIALSATNEDKQQQAKSQYNNLDPLSQIYAQHKKYELATLKTIARDLEKKVPRTDFTSVKSRIKSGETSLHAIMGELPIQWQDIRRINECESPKPPAIKPKPRKFMRVEFIGSDGLHQIDKRVEIHGNWIESRKYGYIAPCEAMHPILSWEGRTTSTSNPEYGLFINQAIGSEWMTELWRKGGFRDERYSQYRDGTSPDQLHRAYRNKQVSKILWIIIGAIGVIDIVMLAARFL